MDQTTPYTDVKTAVKPLGWVAAPVIFYFVSGYVISIGYWLYTTVGLVVSILFLVASFLSMLGFKRQNVVRFGNEISSSSLYIFSVFVGAACLGVFGFAGLSYGLHELGKSAFVWAQPLTVWDLAYHYLWHLLDMFPGIKVWETMQIRDPYPAVDFWSRLTAVIFRGFIVLPFLGLLKSLLQLSIEDGEGERPREALME